MHDKFPEDDLAFDRLVDGELSPAERRELLASLDDRPDGWRHCALSFLEAQSWREGLRQFAHNAGDAQGTQAERRPAGATPKRGHMPRGVAWLAIAAGLFLAFTLGTMSRDGGAPLANSGALKPDLQIADIVPPPPASSPRSSTAADALTLFVRDERGQTRPLRVPLVDAGTLQRQLGLEFQSGVPAHVRSQLKDRGFDVWSKQRYAPLWLEDGRPMFVPVEDTKIVPVSRNVY
jgi:hypothetical protein